MDIDDDVVQDRIGGLLAELRALVYDAMDGLEPNDLIELFNDHELFVVPSEDV